MTEFRDAPTLLLFADEEAQIRARASAEAAGCRVAAIVPIEGAPDRLRRQAHMDVAFVDLEGGEGPALDPLLDMLEADAEAGRYRGVVAFPQSLLTRVLERWSPSITYLCEAEEGRRVGEIASASARPVHRLNDAGRDRAKPRLADVSEDLARLSRLLASMSEDEQGPGRAPDLPQVGEGESGIEAGQVRAMIRARRLREQYFGEELFADPAWDILLDLFAARLERRKVAVSSLCIAAAVPATTALRWIKSLTDIGFLVRAADPQDGRRVYIELSDKTAAAMEAYLTAATRISPLAF